MPPFTPPPPMDKKYNRSRHVTQQVPMSKNRPKTSLNRPQNRPELCIYIYTVTRPTTNYIPISKILAAPALTIPPGFGEPDNPLGFCPFMGSPPAPLQAYRPVFKALVLCSGVNTAKSFWGGVDIFVQGPPKVGGAENEVLIASGLNGPDLNKRGLKDQ